MRSLLVANWNVLADCYSFGLCNNSPPPLSLEFEYRSNILKNIFTNLVEEKNVGLFLLQEVDHFTDFYKPVLNSLGMTTLYLQRPKRNDGCLIAYDDKQLTLSSTEEIQLDELAKHCGLQYSRSNVGLFAKFFLNNDRACSFAVSSCHLYWNPSRPQVKLKQTKYILERFKRFRDSSPGLLAGDFNALPGTDQYEAVVNGFASDNDGTNTHKKKMKFLCDASLTKFCRWLRLLGYNTAIESPLMLALRSQKEKDFSALFDKARKENRILITSSRSMVERAACPDHYFVHTKDLMSSLVDLIVNFNLEVTEDTLLTVCGKCGGI